MGSKDAIRTHELLRDEVIEGVVLFLDLYYLVEDFFCRRPISTKTRIEMCDQNHFIHKKLKVAGIYPLK